ncbi:MAG: 4-hydroxy-tetrahydrodipicolinate synthase [Bryobacteraceae bacterium]
MFQGCGTALVTPFRKDHTLDEETLRALVRRQLHAGINFLVPCGTTGENPTLSRAEHLRVVEITVEVAAGNVPVLAGCGGYNTAEVIELGKEIKAIGASGILSVSPYYNKPTQEGLYQHFKAIASSVGLPVILYNVQSRTSINIEAATMKRLSDVDYIIGVKEASGNIGQIASILAQAPQTFAVLSGDDVMTLPVVALGGRGVVSVASNEIPAEMTLLTAAALAGNFIEARELQNRFLPLLEVNFIESNPGPVKAAMARMGLLDPVWRLPLVAPSAANQQKIEKVLESVGLLADRHAHAG